MEAIAITAGVGLGVGVAGGLGAAFFLIDCLAKKVIGLFGSKAALDIDLYDAEASEKREQAGAWLQARGYTQINSRSDCKLHTHIKLTDESLMQIVDSVSPIHPELKLFLTKNLKMLQSATADEAPLMDQMMLTIDGRGRVVAGHTTADDKDLLRVLAVVFAGNVEARESGSSFATAQEVHDCVSALGSQFAEVADQFKDFGITGAFLDQHGLSDEDLREHFNLQHPMKRRAVLAQLGRLEQIPANVCAFALLMSEITFTWKPQMRKVEVSQGGLFYPATYDDAEIPGPSMEEVQEKLKTMQEFQCIRQLKTEIDRIDSHKMRGPRNS